MKKVLKKTNNNSHFFKYNNNLMFFLILLQLISQDIMLFIITQITNYWKMVGHFSKLKKSLLNLFTLQIQIGEYPTST